MAKKAMADCETSAAQSRKKRRILITLVAAALAMVFLISLFLSISNPGKPEEQCNLFSGEWIPKPSGPDYTNGSCKFIEDPQNCMKNGRPDTGYLYWRWKPHHCDLPPLDAEKFLNSMQNKNWAFIGDSMFRNQMQSLICFLSQVEEPVEIYHDKEYKSRTWFFSSHNLTLATIWAPFLVRAETSETDDGKDKAEIQLHLDILDKNWTSQYHNFDYIIIAGGQWFLKSVVIWENNKVIGCHNCIEKNLTELGVEDSYRKALRLALYFISTSHHRPLVIFRTWTPDHFAYGEWFSGGVCNRTTPYQEGEYYGKSMDYKMRRIEIEEFNTAAALSSQMGAQIKLMDVYHLSMLRPDGHPGPYRRFHPDTTKKLQNDCLHWCLPGPIDVYNELLMKMVLNEDDLNYVLKDETQSKSSF